MKKPTFRPALVIPEETVSSAFIATRVKPAERCIVCSGEASPGAEQLCWVCRRLKISAWREMDQQAQAQE